MDKQFYSAYDIADIMGICYAKALAFIKYSGIDYQPFLICAPAAHDVSTIRTFYIKASIHTLVPVFNWWALCNSVSKPP